MKKSIFNALESTQKILIIVPLMGVLMSHVDFKKDKCCPVKFKKCSCHGALLNIYGIAMSHVAIVYMSIHILQTSPFIIKRNPECGTPMSYKGCYESNFTQSYALFSKLKSLCHC